MSSVQCKSCKETVEPSPPRSFYKILNVAFWVAMMVMSVPFGGIIGLSLVLVPAWLAMAGSVAASAERASTWTCPVCKHELAPPLEVMEEELGHAIPPFFQPQHA